MERQLDGELAQDAITVARDEAIERSFNLEEPRTPAVFERQVEKQMTVHNVAKGFALAGPHGGQAAWNALPEKIFVEALPQFRELPAVVVIECDGARPMDGGVGDQGTANFLSVIDCLDDIGRLMKFKALGAVQTIPPRFTVLTLSPAFAYNR